MIPNEILVLRAFHHHINRHKPGKATEFREIKLNHLVKEIAILSQIFYSLHLIIHFYSLHPIIH